MSSKATEKYWDDHWKGTRFEIAPSDHPIREWIEEQIPETTTGRCIEIGCYPGKFLSVFGEKGYELSGIDLFPGVEDLLAWFKNVGYRCAHFYKADFLTFSSPERYDIVCSFGFIEHFKNWPEVLDKHLELLKPGGKIVLDVPNLNSPLYHTLYTVLEPNTLDNHVLGVMNLESITKVLEAKGCRITYAGYVGHFYFRFVTKQGVLYRDIENLLNFFGPLWKLFPDSLYKRYIGVIATKDR